MLFSDPIFFIFFTVYILVDRAIPRNLRLYILIAASTIFYGWSRVGYVWVPYLLSVIAWAGVAWFERSKEPAARKRRLLATIVALFGPLLIFKYAHFLVYDVVGVIVPFGGADVRSLKLALPLGISFVTFTLTAYVIDVYRGRYPAEHGLPLLLGYVLFFPHLIAGPILRPRELMPQLRQPMNVGHANLALGFALFTLGLVKKLVFADTIGPVVDNVFEHGANPSALDYVVAIYGFTMQIYCDFSGYSDMAIGLAHVLRIRLPQNFAAPYSSRSVIAFWRRWHITLSHWLRDYLYIPLGGNRLGRSRQILNVMLTMMLGGLWHGANWTFLLWGSLHGVALAGAHLIGPALSRNGLQLPCWLQTAVTFHFVTVAWVYFRAPDIATAHRVLAGPFMAPVPDIAAFMTEHGFSILLLGVFLATHRYDRHPRVRLLVRRCRKSVLCAMIVSLWILAISVSQGSSAKFIYFDF
jgi:alginate O-acetyltransferase complex protein AlgI